MSAKHKITFRESELMTAIAGESRGCLTKEMACYLLQTTPQAIGKLALSLAAKNILHRECDGTMRLNKTREADKSDPCPICGKPFKTCGHF